MTDLPTVFAVCGLQHPKGTCKYFCQNKSGVWSTQITLYRVLNYTSKFTAASHGFPVTKQLACCFRGGKEIRW